MTVTTRRLGGRRTLPRAGPLSTRAVYENPQDTTPGQVFHESQLPDPDVQREGGVDPDTWRQGPVYVEDDAGDALRHPSGPTPADLAPKFSDAAGDLDWRTRGEKDEKDEKGRKDKDRRDKQDVSRSEARTEAARRPGVNE